MLLMQVLPPPVWMVFPFILLLLLMAAGPLWFPGFWHRNYKIISIGLGIVVAGWYVLVNNEPQLPIESLAEYSSFISLLVALFVVSGGIYLFADFESNWQTNISFLFFTSLLASFIGTTGASVLFIRPYMRINRYRLAPYHIVFFIFLVSNIGGSLTPVGDPPLFMGFLKGVPFEWTLAHLTGPWLVSTALLLLMFYFFERGNTRFDEVDVSAHYTRKVYIQGKRNFIWLALVLGSVFLDPNIISNLPALEIHGRKISFIRELVQLTSAWLCYKLANKKALQSNDFGFEPILEVAYLFFGIFLCMLPGLAWMEHLTRQSGGGGFTPGAVFWLSGSLSSVLDNAPTYINVLAALLAEHNLHLDDPVAVQSFAKTTGTALLEALSAGAVFFGAMTYIGNGPNLMVKSIAEQSGVKMPGFGGYLLRYSLPLLLPVLVVVWLVFFF